MNLEQFDPGTDPAAVRDCYAAYVSGGADDDPDVPLSSLRMFTGWMMRGWTEDPPECWLARDEAGQVGGYYVLTAPQRENRHLAGIVPQVSAARRRQGTGTRLVRHAAARARDLGRTALTSDARAGSPGDRFAQAIGAQRGVTEIRRVLRLDGLPAGQLARLRAEAESAAAGYALLGWDGATPDDQLAAVAAVNMAMADSPRPDSHEAQRWDAERVRQNDLRAAAQGLRMYTIAARSQATGELAGLTQLGVDPAEPGWGLQSLTAVSRTHRGHRLGLLVKAALLERLAEREPQLTSILTGNADGNEHMIAINARLGFTVLDHWSVWEIGTTALLTSV